MAARGNIQLGWALRLFTIVIASRLEAIALSLEAIRLDGRNRCFANWFVREEVGSDS